VAEKISAREGFGRRRAPGPRPAAIISRDSPVPLHLQFRQYLLDMIERGDLLPGEQLPRETELAKRHGVSLAPVRQAILDLVKEGFVYRVRGRGTFVREQKVDEKISILSSFTESMRAKGVRAEVHVLRQERVPAPVEVREALRLRGRDALLIERRALVGGEPVALLAAFLPPRKFHGLASVPLDGRSLYQTLGERYGTTLARAESLIEVGRCGPEQAALLGVPAGSPVLLVAGTTFDEHDDPVEYSRVTYRADRFRFRLDSYRRSDQVFHLIHGGRAQGAKG
jgi:GntR family transcriptional regulator